MQNFRECCVYSIDSILEGGLEVKRSIKTIALLLAVILFLTACGTIVPGSQPEASPVRAELKEAEVTNLNDSFDADFLSYVQEQNEKENYVVSPLSFRAALMLAVEGANDTTRAQLMGAMGFSSAEEMDLWYQEVQKSVASFDEWFGQQEDIAAEEAQYYPPGEAPELPDHAYRVLNSIWNNTDKYGEFLPDYVRAVDERYGATADSKPADQITDAVNHWCDEATAGLIPKISEDLSEYAAILANAVYLKSSWAMEFSKYMTEPEDFTDVDGNVTSREMMKAKEQYMFYEDAETRLISIPLHGGLSFVAVLGDDSNWLEDYNAAEYTDVDLWLPKLDTESSFGKDTLVQYLQDRGATEAFDANTADFSRMADYPWYISDIVQKAKIKTDEEGLEAAAVTIIMVAEGAALETEEPQYKEFHANEPFRYYVVTTSTQTPLVVFAGQEVK